MSRSAALICFGMIAAWGLPTAASTQEESATTAVSVYQSTQPQLPIRFEYPTEWEAEESSGTVEVYAQVQVYAPASFENRLRTYMVVRAVPVVTQGGRYGGVDEMVAEYRKTLPPTLGIEQERSATILGLSARQLDLSGTLQLPWWSQQSRAVPVKGQRVFFEKQGRLYEVGWLTTPEVSDEVEGLFAHLLRTLTISE